MTGEPPFPPQRGDEAALHQKYDKRLRRITTLSVNTTPDIVDDACNFAWMQFIEKQPRRETAFPWLRTVARREAIRLDGIARRLVSIEHEDRGLEAGPARDITSNRRTIETTQQMLEARERLEELPERLREVTFLRAAGWTYDQIAAHLHVSYTRVNQLVVRANSRLREMDYRDLELTPRAARLQELLADTPSYLVASIGAPPLATPRLARAEQRLEWSRLALAIEDYRAERAVTDSVYPLGRDRATDPRTESLHREISEFRRARGLVRRFER